MVYLVAKSEKADEASNVSDIIFFIVIIFGRFVLCYQTVACPVLSVCPVCDIGVLRPKGWMDQDETWHTDRPRPWPQCVTWGLRYPSPKGAQSPSLFSTRICCGQMARRINMPLVMEVGLGQATLC